jgi:uncharacterized protein YciW
MCGINEDVHVYHLHIIMYVRVSLDDDTPMYFILKILATKGWTSGRAPLAHTAASALTFGAKVHQCVAKRAYLQCLVTIDTLREHGLEALPSGQQQGYYKALLKSAFPATVKVGQRADYYKALLKEEHADSDRMPSNDTSDSDNAEERIGPPAKHVCTPTEADPRKLIQGRSLPFTEAHPRTNHADPLTIDAEGAVSEAIATVEATGLTEEDDVIICDAAWTSMDISYGVALECRGSPGQVGHYRRLRLNCKLSQCKHSGSVPCNKSRVLNATGMFGKREPEAFLIAWADAAHRFSTRAAHMKHMPSHQEVREVLQRSSVMAA